jgi:uncharacterized protein (UPF0333 family)
MKLIYLSGKITDTNKLKFWRNIYVAWKAAKELSKKYAVFCPHTNGFGFKLSYDRYIAIDKEIIKRCDAVYVLPNWKTSNGCKIEIEFAKKNNIPVKFL